MIEKVRMLMGHLLALTSGIGLLPALNLLLRRAFGMTQAVTVSCGPYRLDVRPADSDPYVLTQIFTAREYAAHPFWGARLNAIAAALRRAGRVPVIIDAGANVGYSALFLADQFPDAVVLAVEPDEDCVALIERNCGDHPRIAVVRAALWSHRNGVEVNHPMGESWANRVSDTGTTPSVTLEQLLEQVAGAAPLVLKLDIEGAEAEVCAASAAAVAAFPCIMIEPHDWMLPGSGVLSPLYSAIAGKQMDTVIRGEVLMLFDCAAAEGIDVAEVS